MRQFLLLFICSAVFCTFCKAQFPAFTNFEGVKYYVNNRGDSATKKYRAIYGIGDRIDSYFADSLRERANKTEQIYTDSIEKVIKNNTLSAAIKNSRLTDIRDSISLYSDVKDYYASINKFTGTPKYTARVLPVLRSYQARFFYQNSPQTDSTERKVDFLSNFILQSNIDKTAISSDLISGALWIFKASISTTVVDNNDSTNAQKVNNKINYGSLLNGRVSLPLLYSISKYLAIYVPLSFTASVDNVSVNKDTLTSNTFYFREFAASLYIRIPFINTNYEKNNTSLFFNGKMGHIDGNSNFYDKLEDFRKGFWLARGTAGIEVNNKFRLAVNFPLYSSEKKVYNKQTATIGIQIDPKMLSTK